MGKEDRGRRRCVSMCITAKQFPVVARPLIHIKLLFGIPSYTLDLRGQNLLVDLLVRVDPRAPKVKVAS